MASLTILSSLLLILFQEIVNNDNVRESMKKKAIEVQGRELLQMMMVRPHKINTVKPLKTDTPRDEKKCQSYRGNFQ